MLFFGLSLVMTALAARGEGRRDVRTG